MTTKFIFALKALEKDLDRQTVALLEEAPPNIEAMKQKNSTAYLQLARRMIDEGYIEQGLAICRKAVRVQPGNLDANYYLMLRSNH